METPAYLPYILPSVAILGLLQGWVVWALRSAFKGGLAQFQLDLLEKINGKYLHSAVADEKFGRLEDKLNTINEKLGPQPVAAAARRKARG